MFFTPQSDRVAAKFHNRSAPQKNFIQNFSNLFTRCLFHGITTRVRSSSPTSIVEFQKKFWQNISAVKVRLYYIYQKRSTDNRLPPYSPCYKNMMFLTIASLYVSFTAKKPFKALMIVTKIPVTS